MTTHYQKDPTTAVCGISTQNYSVYPELVTCKRCLKAMTSQAAEHDAKMVAAIPLLNDITEPTTEPTPARKPAKQPKPATIHLHDIERSEHGTWCRIPGQHTTDVDAVTCKVCRTHIDGKAPLNAVPERVKQARKAFRSFVARVAYMVFMDRDCSLSGSWIVKYTNMAGDRYAVSSYGIYENGEPLEFGPGEDIKQWMEEHWSCGEEK